MATKLSTDKLAARYAKVTEQLGSIDARKAKAQRTLDGIEGEREELSLKRDLLKVQFVSNGGNVEDLPVAGEDTAETAPAAPVEDDADESDDFEDA